MAATDAEKLADEIAERLESRFAGPRPLYSPKTLAERLALSERTVRDMLANGTIRSLKVGDARRIEPEEVERYLAERRGDV